MTDADADAMALMVVLGFAYIGLGVVIRTVLNLAADGISWLARWLDKQGEDE
jgi:hypothetical protein